MGREDPQLKLRLSEDLKARISEAAARNGRSMNAEIVWVLEQHYPAPWPLEARIEEMIKLAAALRDTSDSALVEKLTDEMRETLKEMASGRITGISERAREIAREKLETMYDLATDLEI